MERLLQHGQLNHVLQQDAKEEDWFHVNAHHAATTHEFVPKPQNSRARGLKRTHANIQSNCRRYRGNSLGQRPRQKSNRTFGGASGPVRIGARVQWEQPLPTIVIAPIPNKNMDGKQMNECQQQQPQQ
jgi:hypothetical protein